MLFTRHLLDPLFGVWTISTKASKAWFNITQILIQTLKNNLRDSLDKLSFTESSATICP